MDPLSILAAECPLDSATAPDPIRLGEFRLDLGAGTLTRAGRIVELRAKPFRLLCHLARNAGRVLSKEELLDAVWPDVIVTEDSLTQAIRDIRVVLGPAADALRTVPRRGYMLDLGATMPPPPAPQRLPRVAIAAVASAGLAPQDSALPALIHDGLAGGLAAFRSLRVTRGEGGAPQDADYLAEGLVWSDSSGPVLRLKLIDITEDRVTWSETFACGPGPGLDREALRRMVGALCGALESFEQLRSFRGATGDATAWEHFARGLVVCGTTDPHALTRAAESMEAATRADPGFGLAWSYRAYAELSRHDFLMAPPEVMAGIREMAERGAALAPDEARAISMLGYVMLMQGEFAAAEARITLALRLNPASIDILMDNAILAICRGRPAEALDWLDRAEAILPLRYGPWTPALRGDALYHLGRYEEAAAAFRAMGDIPARRHLWLAAAHAMAGQSEEAQAALARFRAAMPGADPIAVARHTYHYEREADSRHLLDGIARAMRGG
jgi:tetratricopeptide (TPR) repeat protein